MQMHHRVTSTLSWLSAAACLPISACGTDRGRADEVGDGFVTIGQVDDGDEADADAGDATGEDSTSAGEGDTGDDGIKFDLGVEPDGGMQGSCSLPEHTPCDANSEDPWQALGINCPGEPTFNAEYNGHPDALYLHTGQLGTYDPPTYPVHEGSKMVILSSGAAKELAYPPPLLPSAFWGQDPVQLPAPIMVNPVGLQTCAEEPALVGTGDCSNTIFDQWQGNGVYDYAELRLSGTVPGGASGFAYDLAFFSIEYPMYYTSKFNDMYIAWLQSEKWTGNVSFDELGHAISLNASFLDYKDAPNPYDCPEPCVAPELEGTAADGHAATKWLTTTAAVSPGEDFVLLLAIFDLSDPLVDSMILLDNFRWTCEGDSPFTVPG